jgi:glutathione S-transferase
MSAPSMTLYYNAASPFARKVLVLLRETSQVDRITLKAVALTPVSPDAEVCANNPTT